MTADAARKRAFWQIFLLSAGLLVLVAISATSVVLVNQARKDAGRVVHTIEVENQLATLLLEIRRAESAARAYLLNSQDSFLREHEAAVAVILPGVDQLAAVTSDNPVQVENMKRLRPAVMERMAEFARAVNFVKGNDTPSAIAMLPQTGAGPAVQAIAEAARAMRLEEQNLFIERTQKADRTQQLSSIVSYRFGPGHPVRRRLALPGAAVLQCPRRGRSQAARQQPQPRKHRAGAHRRPARGQ